MIQLCDKKSLFSSEYSFLLFTHVFSFLRSPFKSAFLKSLHFRCVFIVFM